MGLRVYDPNNDPENQEDQEGQGGQGGGIQTAPAQGVTTSSSGSVGSLGQRQKSSSGNFTNTQKYRQANQLGAQGLAQGVSNKISQIAQQGKDELQGQLNEFNTAQEAEKDRIEGIAKAVKDSKDALVSGGENFDQGLQAVEQGLNVDYAGPQGLRNMGLIQEQAENARQIGKSTQNDSGRLALLQRFYNQPDYNRGQQRLDTLLLGGQANRLKDARQASQELGAKLPGVTNQIRDQVQTFIDPKTGLVQKTRDDVRTLATQAVDENLNSLKKIASDITRERSPGEYTQAIKASANTPLDLTFHSLNPGQGPVTFTDNISYDLQITPDVAKALGVLKWVNPDNPNLLTEQELLGRADPEAASRYNRLLSLLDPDAQFLVEGPKLREGQFQLDQKELDRLATDALTNVWEEEARVPGQLFAGPTLKELLNLTSYSGSAYGVTRDQVLAEAKKRVMERLGIQPAYSTFG